MANRKELYAALKQIVNAVHGENKASGPAATEAMVGLNEQLDEFIEGAHAAFTVNDADGTVEGVALFVPKDKDGKNERKLAGYIESVVDLIVMTLSGTDTVNVIKNRNGHHGLCSSIDHVDPAIRFATVLE